MNKLNATDVNVIYDYDEDAMRFLTWMKFTFKGKYGLCHEIMRDETAPSGRVLEMPKSLHYITMYDLVRIWECLKQAK